MHVFIPILFLLAIQGYILFPGQMLPPPHSPLTLVLAEVTLEAPVSSPMDLYTFNDRPSQEAEQGLLTNSIGFRG